MRKLILTLLFSFGLLSCASSQSLKSFISQEILNNKKQGTTSILFSLKSNSQKLLGVYNDPLLRHLGRLSKNFNQKEFDILLKESKKDTIIQYWTEKEQIEFGFDEFIKIYCSENSLELEKKYKGKTMFYQLSNPIYTNNGENAIFLLFKTKGHRKFEECSAIVMKKENENWVFFERLKSSSEFD